MSGGGPEGNVELSLSRARSVNRLCDRYEAAWRAGERPTIATYLEASDPDERSALFRELLALEVELRREQGEDPTVDEYLAQFADRQALIAVVFSQIETASAPTGGALRQCRRPAARV